MALSGPCGSVPAAMDRVDAARKGDEVPKVLADPEPADTPTRVVSCLLRGGARQGSENCLLRVISWRRPSCFEPARRVWFQKPEPWGGRCHPPPARWFRLLGRHRAWRRCEAKRSMRRFRARWRRLKPSERESSPVRMPTSFLESVFSRIQHRATPDPDALIPSVSPLEHRRGVGVAGFSERRGDKQPAPD